MSTPLSPKNTRLKYRWCLSFLSDMLAARNVTDFRYWNAYIYIKYLKEKTQAYMQNSFISHISLCTYPYVCHLKISLHIILNNCIQACKRAFLSWHHVGILSIRELLRSWFVIRDFQTKWFTYVWSQLLACNDQTIRATTDASVWSEFKQKVIAPYQYSSQQFS